MLANELSPSRTTKTQLICGATASVRREEGIVSQMTYTLPKEKLDGIYTHHEQKLKL
jgi:hypothetical protein